MIRPLTESDAEAYSALRLRALTEHPEAFGSSPADHPDLGGVRERFRTRWGAGPDSQLLGALSGGELVGLCHVARVPYAKSAHKGSITHMYVAPEARGRGLGRALLTEAIARARAWGIERLELAVVTDNAAALHLYASLGFRTWGVEPQALRVDGRDYDEAWMTLEL